MKAFAFTPIGRTPVLLFPPKSRLRHPFISRPSQATCFKVSNSANEKTQSSSPDAKLVVSDYLTDEKIRVAEELRQVAEEALEWRAVCLQLSAFASTAATREVCRNGMIPVGRDRTESNKLLGQTAAAVALPEKLDFVGAEDVSEIVRTAVDGEVLNIRELCAVRRSLESAKEVFEQLVLISSMLDSSDRYFHLLEILENCDFLTELASKVAFCINCNLSIVLDQASPKLESIRSERRQNMERMESLLKVESTRVFQAGGIERPLITKRRARMCIGVRASQKFLLPEGVLLSTSSSGATYFMEPRSAVELNNLEVMLSTSEKAEELAILDILTFEVRESEAKIRHLMEKILELDLACARGAYALWMDGKCPVFCDDSERKPFNEDSFSVEIEGIHHPLLLEPFLRSLSSGLSLEVDSLQNRMEVATSQTGNLSRTGTPIPIDIKIGAAIKVVVISGPNTGGKTASMKTLGLASLMSKAGMFLPAKEQPKIPWFDQILVDIGDQQSLEHNLSTFSGHISRLCKILRVTTKKSLVIIDEIGSGTDPSEGVALSSSILQYLADCVNLVVVTTHYADLSLLKKSDSRFENAAMEFCTETLQPTYRILWGGTGNSNALSIAKSIGFDQKVLNRAQQWVEKLAPDKQKARHGLLYQSLLEERSMFKNQAGEAASLLSDIKKLYVEIQSEADDLDMREMALKAKESRNLQQELKTARDQMEAVIKNFESQLQNGNPYQFNTIMTKSGFAISSIASANQHVINMVPEEEDRYGSYTPKIGDQVFVKGLGDKVAVVIEAPTGGGVTMVQYGKLKVRVKKNDMRPMQTSMRFMANSSGPRDGAKQHQMKHDKRFFKDIQEEGEVSFGAAVRTSKNTLNLRGMRAEEASLSLEMAIAAAKSNSVLFVIHGVGTGIVKEHAISILRNHPRVLKFEEESPMNHGCTIAYLK
ncbi:hypothetical protein HPP92_028136 [Vanilla planifolia]|uniref:Smr domain-containing protein n=1 Tax=Vanilla planifolia TaxID=51239 RepID=A0A835U362_VANPL|nr:hypothetical protein HPP92_028136 [Vanilla planifolia]KAG0447890.1 hypothetical protein HPP92_028115 [Vanilla planifolia]